ncbi:hypothetical protein EAI85_13500 [Enterococcus durans]|nr:hypothetical protein EAI85_13500 [Enterococcus durans]
MPFFMTMRTYTPLQNWVVFVLKKMYQKSASRQQILETPENDPKRSFRPKQNRNRENSTRNEPEQPPIKRDQSDHNRDHGPSL